MCYENREDIADKADQCYRLSRSTSIHLYDPPTVTLVTVRYLDAVYNFMTGKKGAWGESAVTHLFQLNASVASLAESTRLAIFLQLHQESSYKFMSEMLSLKRSADRVSFHRVADKTSLVLYTAEFRYIGVSFCFRGASS